MGIEFSVAILSAITVGLVQVAKAMGLTKQYVPLCSVIIGVGLSFLAMPVVLLNIYQTAFVGLIVGLSAVGLYSGVKNTAGK